MAVNQYYQVKFRYHIGAHIKENVMNYQQTVVDGAANQSQALFVAWDAMFTDAFAAVMSSQAAFDYLDVTNLDDPTDNYRAGVGLMSNSSGDVAGERVAHWNAYVWTKTPVNRTFKTGLFRLRGVVEAQTFSEQVNDENLTPFTNITNILADNLLGADDGVWQPVILRRVRVPLDPNQPFESFSYSHSLISGISFKQVGHLVNNK